MKALCSISASAGFVLLWPGVLTMVALLVTVAAVVTGAMFLPADE